MGLADATGMEAVDLLRHQTGLLDALGRNAQRPVLQAGDAFLEQQLVQVVLECAQALGDLIGEPVDQRGPMGIDRPIF